MSDEPIVNLEESEEIDWLREGRPRNTQIQISEAELQDTEALLQVATVEGKADADDVDDASQEFNDAVNMTASEIRDWSENLCSDKKTMVNPEEVRQQMLNLLETPKEDWKQAEVDATNRVISFISRMRDNEQGEGTEDCPSGQDISLMNWGFKPEGVDIDP